MVSTWEKVLGGQSVLFTPKTRPGGGAVLLTGVPLCLSQVSNPRGEFFKLLAVFENFSSVS